MDLSNIERQIETQGRAEVWKFRPRTGVKYENLHLVLLSRSKLNFSCGVGVGWVAGSNAYKTNSTTIETEIDYWSKSDHTLTLSDMGSEIATSPGGPLEINKGALLDLILHNIILKPIKWWSKSRRDIDTIFQKFEITRFYLPLTQKICHNLLNFLYKGLIFRNKSSFYVFHEPYLATLCL